MTAPVKQIINNNTFWLSPQRCIFWEEEKTLILSDLHFGKTGHFRKNGIPVPQQINIEDLQRLFDQIIFFIPERVIVVGDLFHSHNNDELNLFIKWRNDFPTIPFILVKGNHDILLAEWYEKAGINTYEGIYNLSNVDFFHDPTEKLLTENVNFIFSGHLHPGVRISGKGKQHLQFPCFHITEKMLILPAFSKFSGLSFAKKNKQIKIFAIINQSIVLIK